MIAIYARISTEEQSQYSITSQLRECQKKANSEFKEYIDDGYSGEFLDRPALTQLRQDVKNDIVQTIVCYDPDRLSRKLMNQLILTDEFEKRGVEILFVSSDYQKTPEGSLFYQMRGAIAEFEKAKINERMSRGRKEKARQGRVLRDFQIYGYGYDKAKESMVVFEEEAEVVRLVFDLFTKPNNLVKGMNGIATYLTNKGIPTKRGAAVWHRQVVRQLLMNRAYIGEFYQNRWNTEGMLGNKYRPEDEKVSMKMRPQEDWIPIPCPPIIDDLQFEHAQKLLKESKRRWAKQSIHSYLLSGVLRCSECGNTMTGRKAKNWGTVVYEYTCVKNTAGSKNKGCGNRLSCDKLDGPVWEQISSWITNPAEIAKAETPEQTSFEESELVRVEKELDNIKAGRKKLLRLFRNGLEDIGEEDIRDELKHLKLEEDRLTERMESLQIELKEKKTDTYSQTIMQDAVDYFVDNNTTSFEVQQTLIRMLIREIQIDKKENVKIYRF